MPWPSCWATRLPWDYVGDGGPLDKERAATRAPEGSRVLRDATAPARWQWCSHQPVQLIGYCGIEIGEDTGELELNYGLSPAWWGQGLALEAATAVLSWADGFCEIAVRDR